MAVPGHDQRDWDFASTFSLPIVEVIKGGDISKGAFEDINSGELVNSDFINGLRPDQAIQKMNDWLEQKGIGRKAVNFKLRDWVFSRQRYWGEPIPLVECKKCGWVPVNEEDLPLTLPDIEDYKTASDGSSPISRVQEWVNTTCPKCGGVAKRETDTMPQWAGSSWYFLRYVDPHNDSAFASRKLIDYWMPVDWYNGGREHTTLHLLYSRFWHQFLFDIGLVNTSEPYVKRTSHGIILGENHEKMSKSRGNVVNPDEIVNESGADTFRLYEMFMGAFDQVIPWNSQQIAGVNRFVCKIWKLAGLVDETKEFEDSSIIHKTIKKVTEDIESMKFNTAIAAMMTLSNELSDLKRISRKSFEIFLKLIHPFAPHVTEELWSRLGYKETIQYEKWPDFDPKKVIDETITIAVQINGKLRGTVEVPFDSEKDAVKEKALLSDKIRTHLDEKNIVKEIYVKNKIFNIVVR